MANAKIQRAVTSVIQANRAFLAKFDKSNAPVALPGPRIFPDCVVNAASYVGGGVAPGEIVTGVEIAAMAAHGWAVEEISRRAGDFAIVAVVALVRLDRLGRVDDARLAFGGVADRPVHAHAAEDALRGHEPTADVVARAARVARDALDPPSDAFVSGAYRRHVAGVLCRRALTRAVARALA